MMHVSTVCLLAALLQVPHPPSQDAPPPFVPGDRSVELLRYDCRSTIGRREVTLFANGTVRIRDGEIGNEALGLAELHVEELEGFVNRLREIDLSQEVPLRGLDGDWVEKCRLVVALPDAKPYDLMVSRYQAQSLTLSNLLRLVEDVAAKVTSLTDREQLPVGYEPKLGDVLKRIDGELYRVRGFTADKKAIELQGVTTPLTVFIARDALRREFVALQPPKGLPF
jgi:hypothetical protein